jgi:hypothetical protein
MLRKSLAVVSLLCVASIGSPCSASLPQLNPSVPWSSLNLLPDGQWPIEDHRSDALGPVLLMETRSSPKPAQCRALFETVVSSRDAGSGFTALYSRKAAAIRSLRITDSKLQSLQSRLATTFNSMAAAERSQSMGNQSSSLDQQTAQLVGELNRYCFR